MENRNIVHEADVLVIGGGAAGCWAAIKARQFGASTVIQVDKGKVGRSGTSPNAAGILSVFYPEEDDYDRVFREIIDDSEYLIDQDRLRYHLETIWGLMMEMDSWGTVEMERTPNGKLQRFPGRARVPNMMFHGSQMMSALAKEVRKGGAKQINRVMITDLLTNNGRVVGAVGFDTSTADWHVFKAKVTILAAGCSMYKAGHPGSRGGGGAAYALPYRAGADVTGLELSSYAIHKCASYDFAPAGQMFQGLGVKFWNANGERFMERYEPVLKERAPVDRISPYFGAEVKQGKGPIYLDLTHCTPEEVQMLRRVVPTRMKMYEKVGWVKNDRFTRTMEWVAGPFDARGGPSVDARYETCLPGLFACGDNILQAGDGGGQRALVGAFTSAARAGQCAAEVAKEVGEVKVKDDGAKEFKDKVFRLMKRKEGIEPDSVLLAVQQTVTPYEVFMFRDEERMGKALKEIESIRDNLVPLLFAYDPHYLRMALEARDLATVAEIQLRASIFRKESRIGAIREDYPYTDNIEWLKLVSVKQEKSKMTVFTQELPFDRYPIKPPRKRSLNLRWQRLKDAELINIREEKVVWV